METFSKKHQTSAQKTLGAFRNFGVVLLLFTFYLFSFRSNGQVLVPYQSEWTYYPEDSMGTPFIRETPPPSNWKSAVPFTDALWWKKGKSSFGFGRAFTPPYGKALKLRRAIFNDKDTTTYNYPAFYFRKEFIINRIYLDKLFEITRPPANFTA
jgi:hypothetical protein